MQSGVKTNDGPSTLKSPSVAPKALRDYALAASDCRSLSVEGWLVGLGDTTAVVPLSPLRAPP